MARIKLVRAWTAEDDRQLAEMAAAGMSLMRIAMRMRRTASSVYARATKLGVALPKLQRAPRAERTISP